MSGAIPGLRRTFTHLWPYLRRERRLAVVGCAALVTQIFLRLLEPWPLKFVVDRVLAPAQPGSGAGSALSSVPVEVVLAASAIAVVGVTAFRALSAYASSVSFAVAGHRVMAEVRAHVYRHLQALSLKFHSRSRSGDLTLRVMSDVGVVADVGLTALVPLVVNTLVMIGMGGLMFWMHWRLAAVSLTLLPLFWIVTLRTGRRLNEVSRKQRRREGAMAATAAESIGAIKTLQALSMESRFAETFAGQGAKGLRDGARASRLSARLERAVDVLLAFATALVLWYGAVLVLGGELSTGELLVFLAYVKSTFKPLQDVAKYTNRLAKASAAGERIVDVLDEEPDVCDLPGAVGAPPFAGALAFRGIEFAYEPGRPALTSLNLEVPAGSHLVLVGPSGGGKSTLLHLVLRLHDPDAGSVEIDGRDVRRYTVESLRSQVSVVLQESLLFAASVRDNIAYGAAGATGDEIEAAASLANAHDFIMELPEGYDTVLGERGVTVSGGQRQRIAIARAAVRRAPIVLLDEVTTGLDEENEQEVLAALAGLCRGRTVVSVTHNLALARHADQVAFVEYGRVIEHGSHRDLLARAGRYASLVRDAERCRPARTEPGTHAVAV
jgi:ATP-binding cassette subfamily B protein